MMFDKLLAQLVYPLGLTCALLLLVLLMILLRRSVLVALGVVLSLLWLGFWSLPVVANALLDSLQRSYPIEPVASLPQADVVVVLGGGIRPPLAHELHPDLNEAADRVWHAARIFHQGKAQWILASGGCPLCAPGSPSEASALRAFLGDLGVPADRILMEETSRNTRENAIETAKILRERSIDQVLLVTSALHMRRALGAFRKVGIEAIPAPTDYQSRAMLWPLAWLPDAGALLDSTRVLKEYLGIQVYRWRGWI